MSQVITIIDAQDAFCHPSGTLARAFGKEEISVVRRVLPDIEEFLAQSWPGPIVLVRSEYARGQFSVGQQTSPLSQLCAPGNEVDANWSLSTDVVERSHVVTKTEQSAWVSAEFTTLLQELVRLGMDRLLLGGFLTTSCVRKTALEARLRLPSSVAVAVVKELTASRASNYLPRGGEKSRHDLIVEEFILAGIPLVSAKDCL